LVIIEEGGHLFMLNRDYEEESAEAA